MCILSGHVTFVLHKQNSDKTTKSLVHISIFVSYLNIYLMLKRSKLMRFLCNMYQTFREWALGGPSEAETNGTQ